jgi:FAD/FMN-containing dehydrogenase
MAGRFVRPCHDLAVSGRNPPLDDFVDALGPERVLTGPGDTAPFCVDWTGRFQGSTPAVLRPATTEQVAAVVALCRRHALALTLQGGNTGLVGGSVPLAGEIVLSLRDLDRVAPVDEVSGQVTAGAGASLAAVHGAAAATAWAYGVDFASRDWATIGGTIATNAGGLRVLRYGDTRAQVVGVEAVLGDGSVVSHLGGPTKDNTGYHLPSLLCGSEGTLGIVTAARLRLVPPATERATALVAFDSIEGAVAAAGDLRRHVPTLEAAELMLAAGIDLVCRVTARPPPRRPPPGTPSPVAFLLVEAADRHSPAVELAAAIGALTGVVHVTAVATDPVEAAALWRYREDHAAAVNTLGPPHKFDVSLPGDGLAAFVDEAPAIVAAVEPGAATWMWAHAADGNVHVNVTGLAPDDDRVSDAILRSVAARGGSISGEHGIGSAKRAWLHLNRTTAEIDAFRALKRALDPDGILNPNVLLPPPAANSPPTSRPPTGVSG